MRLRALAAGKVNLCLFLGGLREDGRHELVTLLESVSLADRLTLDAGPGITVDDVVCPSVAGPNLVAVALGALRAHDWKAPPVRIEIAKRIPAAGGMAGGSADAAAALRMAMLVAQLPSGTVAQIAASLGADVPSQLAPGLARGTGAGEVIEPLPPLAPHALLVLPLPFGLRSADVYAEADRLGLPRPSDDLAREAERLSSALRGGSPRLPDELLVNDLEPAALSLCPAIAEALRAAREVGAERALVCGSGPTVAGLYWGADAPSRAARAAEQLSRRFAGATSVSPVGPEYGVPQPSSPSGTI